MRRHNTKKHRKLKRLQSPGIWFFYASQKTILSVSFVPLKTKSGILWKTMLVLVMKSNLWFGVGSRKSYCIERKVYGELWQAYASFGYLPFPVGVRQISLLHSVSPLLLQSLTPLLPVWHFVYLQTSAYVLCIQETKNPTMKLYNQIIIDKNGQTKKMK